MKMPFGRHTGTDLTELPSQYLDWLNKQELQPPLSHEVRRELERRKLGIELEPRLVSFPAVYVKIPREERELAKRMLNVGYRALARKLDPAKGGDPESMRRLFELAATVREQLEVAQ
jgi:hypothetical protein